WPKGWLGWLPFTFYLLAAFSDLLDGYLARINNHVTKLGAALDMNNDSWGVLIVTGLVFWYGQVPIWYLPVGLARYIFIAGLWLREKQGKENLEMPPSFRRRIFAGIQMGFIVSMLAPPFSPPATTLAASLFMLPFLVGFLYDWFLITGKIDPEKGVKLFDDFLISAPMRWIPFIIRLITAATLILLTIEMWQSIFVQLPVFLALLWIIFSLSAIVMLLLGVLGRLGAIFALIVAGLIFSSQANHIFLLFAGTALLFTGTGVFSLWSPEEWLIYNRAGEQADA
ncbi:MAG: CDP-alcohol phosphatidyltransferase family protein, partial [Anaerolineae bacterium]|nr:CDP-alcohol phosphatidyltransferase family protein [Anaerolineae bacterium]